MSSSSSSRWGPPSQYHSNNNNSNNGGFSGSSGGGGGGGVSSSYSNNRNMELVDSDEEDLRNTNGNDDDTFEHNNSILSRSSFADEPDFELTDTIEWAQPPPSNDLNSNNNYNNSNGRYSNNNNNYNNNYNNNNNNSTSPFDEELAAKPKPDKDYDPCTCDRPFDGTTMTCNDLSCVLFACQEECRSNCPAGELCGNKRIQRKQWKPLQVITTPKKGKGIKVLEDCIKGDLIAEYVGRAIHKQYLQRLFRRYSTERKLYIMALDKDIYLDARRKGGIARYINHSCEPNCVVERWKVRGIMRAAVIACKDIPAGTELSFDYQWERKRGRAPTKCHCYSTKCRGTLEVPRSMEEEALERKLSSHWKNPLIKRAGREIINRCIQVFSKETQEYYPADVTQYDETKGKHLVMYRHDLEEVWEDLKHEDWQILDEEAEQFIIRKKGKSTPIGNNNNNNNGGVGGPEKRFSLLAEYDQQRPMGMMHYVKNFLYVQTPIKEALQSKHLTDRCQRSCRVQINITGYKLDTPPTPKDPNYPNPDEIEKMAAYQASSDGSFWRLSIVGSDIVKARTILEKNVAYLTALQQQQQQQGVGVGGVTGGVGVGPGGVPGSGAMGSGDMAMNGTVGVGPGVGGFNSVNGQVGTGMMMGSGELPTEVVLPRSIVDIVKRRLLPLLRDMCRNVNITFVPSESKSKQFAKLIVEGSLQSDVDSAKEQLWKQLNLACEECKAPKTPSGVYKDLGFLGGELNASDFHHLLEFDKTSNSNGSGGGGSSARLSSSASSSATLGIHGISSGGMSTATNIAGTTSTGGIGTMSSGMGGTSSSLSMSTSATSAMSAANKKSQDAKEDLTRWSPFFASFEATQQCAIWVQSDADKGRIDGSNRIVSEARPNAPRKIYIGCDPKNIPKLWKLVQLRASEVARGVKYLYLGPDRLYQPTMMRKEGQFFEFVRKVTGASVTVDSMTGDHLRIDGRGGSSASSTDNNNDPTKTGSSNGELPDNVSEGERAALAEELVRLQIELYRDHCIREQNWIFGRDWMLARRSCSTSNNNVTSNKESSSSSSSNLSLSPLGGRGGSSMRSSSTLSFDTKALTNSCMEIADIVSKLGLEGSVAAHATVIMYRFETLMSQRNISDSQLKIREVLLACIFIANKAQKQTKYKKLEAVLEAAYKIFYPGTKFDPTKEEVLVWEEKVIAAEAEVLETLDYDVFWRGFDWIVSAATEAGGMDRRLARDALTFSVSGPVLAAGSYLWLTYGAEYVFAAAAGFLDAKLKTIFPAVSLIPFKVFQAAEIISESIKITGLGRKQSSHPLFKEGKKGLLSHLPRIKETCMLCMGQMATGLQLKQSSETAQRLRIIGERNRQRRVFKRVEGSVINTYILPALDGVSAESKCSIYVEQNVDAGFHDIVLKGSWRALAIASYLLAKTIEGNYTLPKAFDSMTISNIKSSIQAKDSPGLLEMKRVETSDGWSGTIQSQVTNQSAAWGRKTGGKCCVPGKIKESDLRHAGLRWWIPPRYGPSPTGSICDMFLVNNAETGTLEALANLIHAFQGESVAYSMLASSLGGSNSSLTQNSNGGTVDRFVAVSLQRWPSEKVANREQGKNKKDEKSRSKRSKSHTMQIGFSPAALQEMQVLNQLHGLIMSPQGHPNFILPIGVGLPSEVEKDDMNLSTIEPKGMFDMKSIDEDIFSLTRTSLENEVAAQKERKRKDMVTGPHLVFHPTPFVLERFTSRKKKRSPGNDKDDYSISPQIFAGWFHDLLSAMQHCHANNIILRNIQADQIVIDHSGVAKVGGLYRAHLLSSEDRRADIVKLARKRKEELAAEKEDSRRSSKSKRSDDDEVLANPYVPPEMVLGSQKFTKETDMWTLGCLLAHALLGKPIYSGKDRQSVLNAMYKMIGIPSSENFPEGVRFPFYKKPAKKYRPGVAKALKYMMKDVAENEEFAGAFDLLSEMLHLDPSKRITAVGALQHEYMQNYVEQSNSEERKKDFAKDWVSLKGKLLHSRKADQLKERERGIKRQAMLMAASKSSNAEDDDLYDMDDILGDEGLSKKPKL